MLMLNVMKSRTSETTRRLSLQKAAATAVSLAAAVTLLASCSQASNGTSPATAITAARCGTGPKVAPGQQNQLLGLVADVGTGNLYPVNLGTDKVGHPISIGFGAEAIAITPNGKQVYVADGGYATASSLSNYKSSPVFNGTIVPINLVTGQAGKPISAGFGPIAIAVTPNGKQAYVADMGLLGGLGRRSFAVDGYTVDEINTATDRTDGTFRVGPGPGAIAITPNGKWAYVAVTGTPLHVANYIVPMNLATGKIGKPIHTGISPMAIAITPNGKWAYVANTGWPQKQGHTVTPVNLATNIPGKPIPVGSAPLSIAITPNGKWAYVANSGYGLGKNFTVTPINLTTNTPGKPITVGPGPTWVAITPNGKWAYVADSGRIGNRGKEVTPINIAQNCAGVPIHIGVSPQAIAIASEPATIVAKLTG